VTIGVPSVVLGFHGDHGPSVLTLLEELAEPFLLGCGPDSACHAGGRGFESVASVIYHVKDLKIVTFTMTGS
jgi:hypothetical protein